MPLLGIKRSGSDARQVGTGPAGSVPRGKTDLLLRFFDSHFFDEWIALTYVPLWTLLLLAKSMRLLAWRGLWAVTRCMEVFGTSRCRSKPSCPGQCACLMTVVVSVQVSIQEQFPRRAGLLMQSIVQSLRGWSGEVSITAVPANNQQALRTAGESRSRSLCSKSPHRCEGASLWHRVLKALVQC